jgi:hypothetical protein
MSTLKRYLKIQLQIFLCGIVGPIFLVIFFAVEPDPPKWLYWWGLAITAVDVLIALAITGTGAQTAFSPRAEDDGG